MPCSFAPIIDGNTRILVIGTMPGAVSLERQEYYAHERNLFWKVVSETFCGGRPFASYEEKKACLAGNHIGLWDSVQSCHRVGSLDSAIKNAVPNDFAALLKQYPRTQRLLFNGQKAFRLFERFYPDILEYVDYEVLPSTSPANAAVPYEKKIGTVAGSPSRPSGQRPLLKWPPRL